MGTNKKHLSKHPFFKGIDPWYVEQIARYADHAVFDKGEYLIREKQKADKFFLILDGKVDLGCRVPEKGFCTVQSLGPENILGWSWLLPPYRWHLDAVAARPTSVVVLDGRYLRAKCEEDPELGYRLLKRLSSFVVERLRSIRKETLQCKKDCRMGRKRGSPIVPWPRMEA